MNSLYLIKLRRGGFTLLGSPDMIKTYKENQELYDIKTNKKQKEMAKSERNGRSLVIVERVKGENKGSRKVMAFKNAEKHKKYKFVRFADKEDYMVVKPK